MLPTSVLTLAALLAGTGTASVIDLRVRRVPNWLTGSLAAAGLLLAGAGVGEANMRSALIGGVLGLLLMLPGYLLGGTGAGDVKLLAAAGTFLGPTATLWAFVFTLMAGGLMAVMVAAYRGRLLVTFQRLIVVVGATHASPLRRAATDAIEESGQGNRFAYAPAIALGVLTAAVFA